VASPPRKPNRGPGSSRRPQSRSAAGAKAGGPRASKASRRDGQSPRRPRATGRAAVLALVLLVLVISYASSLRAWVEQRAEIADTQATIAATQQRVDQLEQTKQRWHDEAYIRRMARERFGWVLPGEVGYRVIDENGDTVGDTPRLDDPAEGSSSDQPDWYDQMWGSVEAAGQPLPSEGRQRPQKDKHPNAVIKQEPNRR